MAAIRVTQLILEVLTASGASAAGASAAAASLTASVVWIQSGVSGVQNVVILRGTVVSAEWIVSGGSAHTYSWVTNYAGFVSTATTSLVTRTFSVAPATMTMRQVSTTLSATVSALASTITSAVQIYVGAITVPNYWDGKVTRESQDRRRVWPL